MTTRPRYAGDGGLRLPASVRLPRVSPGDGSLRRAVGELGDSTYDPFGRDEQGLLLPESFARVDLDRGRVVRSWFRTHGVADVHGFLFPGATTREPPRRRFEDDLGIVSLEQANVRWHLETLARLSEHHDTERVVADDRTPHDGWDPRWAQPALQTDSGETIWLGAADDLEGHVAGVVRSYRLGERPDPQPDSEWHRTQSVRQRIRKSAIPMLMVWPDEWRELWREWRVDPQTGAGRLPSGPLHTDWWGLLDLQLLLITPYVRRAARHEVGIDRLHGAHRDPLTDRASSTTPIQVHERRSWTSFLAPVYVQLLEALRRVSEGKAGAAWCRACDQPFLVLDGRRSTFCNQREQNRWAQRKRRAGRRGNVARLGGRDR